MPPPADPHTAVVIARLDDLRSDFAAIRQQLADQSAALVPRSEWQLRNIHVDETFKSQGREISDLRTELRSRQTPWTAKASAIGSILAVSLSVIVFLVAI